MSYLMLEGQQPDDIKRPEVMAYISELQKYLEEKDVVGKTSSVADIVKRVGQVFKGDVPKDSGLLRGGTLGFIPESQDEIGQYLFLFLMSGDPNALDNFVDYDYQKANIWVQMKRGDNRDMERVEQQDHASLTIFS